MQMQIRRRRRSKSLKREPASGGEGSDAPEFEEVKARARRFAMIPLWIGVFLTVLSAWGIYSVQQSVRHEFLVLLFNDSVIDRCVIDCAGRRRTEFEMVICECGSAECARWPRNITLGFPLPLGLTAWFLRTFGHNIRGMKNTNVDEIIQILDATGKSGAPLIINANDNEDGEHVQVYIG